MLVAAHALQAGPLPASQPGFTIIDPLVASLLGVFIFRENIRLGPVHLGVEVVALTSIVAGVIAISHSQLIRGEPDEGAPAEGEPDLAPSRPHSEVKRAAR
jgi:hypothetical protein